MAKRGARGNGEIRYRSSDDRWEGRYIAGRGQDGKPIRRSVYASTQAECRKKLAAIVASLDDNTYQAPNRVKTGEWLDAWLETYAKPTVKPLTASAYGATIRNHIKPAIGGIQLQALRGFHLQRLYIEMQNQGLSGKTIRNTAAVLHKALSVAVKQGLIKNNPCDAAELPRVERREIAPLRDEEIPRFLGAIDSSPYRSAFALCLFAGLREGECLGLPWSAVDFKNKTLTIRQQLQREKKANGKRYILPETKSGRARVIEPPDICFTYLRDERRRQAENRLRAGAAWSNPEGLVFTDALGGFLADTTFYKNFKRIAASIGRPDLRPHDLRHTAATVAIASGADTKSVQQLMGHSSASFTLNVYTHASEQMKRDTAQRVQSYYDDLCKQA